MAIKPLLSQQQRVTYADEEETKLPEPVVPGVKEDQPQTQLVSDGTDVQVTPIMPGQTSAMGPAAPVTAAAPEPVVPEVEPSVANVDTTMPVESAPAAVAKETNVVKRMIDMIKDNLFGTGEQQPLDKALSYAKEKDPEAYQAMDGSNSQQLSAADASFTKNPPKTEQGVQAASVVKGFKIAAQHKELGDEGLRQQIESDGNPLDRVAGDAYLTALALGRPPWKAAEDAMKAHQTAIAKTAEIQAKVYEDRQVIEQQAKMRAKAVTTNTAATERAIYKKASTGFYRQPGGDGGAASVPAAKIAQGLDIIKVGIETGDFASARQQLTENGLDFLKRDIDAAEQRYAASEATITGAALGSKGTGSNLGVFIAQKGPYEGQPFAVRQSPTGGTIAVPVGGTVPLTNEERENAGLIPRELAAPQKGAVAQSQAAGKYTGEAVAKFQEDVRTFGAQAGGVMRDNEQAMSILDAYPNLTEVLNSSESPVIRGLANAIKDGIRVGPYNIGVDLTKALEAAKTERERTALQALQTVLAKKTFNAVQAAGFKGSQSDKELDQIRQSVASTNNTTAAIKAFLIRDTAQAKISELRRDAMLEWKQKHPGPFDRDEFEADFDKKARPIAENAVKQANIVLGITDTEGNVIPPSQRPQQAPAAPSAPAAGSSTVSEGFEEYTVNGKRHIRKKKQ